MKKLLDGICILEVTTIVMGPLAGQILADLGAEVIKLEPLDGDLARYSGTVGPSGMGALFANNNRNKKSIAVDLRKPEGQAVLKRLIKHSDVLLHNMRPKAADRLGLSLEAARATNDKIIHCAAVGFGSDGPYAGRAAYDDVIQAVSGVAALPLEMGREPQYAPTIMADKVAALHVVYSILAALMRRERSGEACAVEVPMFEAITAFLLNEHLDGASFNEDARPGYVRLLNPNRKPYKTADGWLAVMPYSGAHWEKTLADIGEEAVMKEAWFATAAGRNANSETLYGLLVKALPGRTTAEWVDTFSRLDIPHAVVNTMQDLMRDEHLQAVDFFRPTDGLEGRLRSVPQPVKFMDVEETPDGPPPELGVHADSILADLGYSNEEIAELRKAGVLSR